MRETDQKVLGMDAHHLRLVVVLRTPSALSLRSPLRAALAAEPTAAHAHVDGGGDGLETIDAMNTHDRSLSVSDVTIVYKHHKGVKLFL